MKKISFYLTVNTTTPLHYEYQWPMLINNIVAVFVIFTLNTPVHYVYKILSSLILNLVVNAFTRVF